MSIVSPVLRILASAKIHAGACQVIFDLGITDLVVFFSGWILFASGCDSIAGTLDHRHRRRYGQ